MPNENACLTGHKRFIWCIDTDLKNRLVASGGADQRVRLWSIRTQKMIGSLRGHENGISEVSFSADGRCLISGGDDRLVRLWDNGVLEGT